MTRYRFAAALCAAAASLCAAPLARATPATLVTGQTLSLPLTEDSDGLNLKLTITSAAFKGSAYQAVAPVVGETRDERKARGDQMVLDNIEGRNLVKFVRYVGDDLRGHYAAAHAPVAVSAAFNDYLKVNAGALTGDALKAGLTLGFGEPATTPITFVTHLELTVDGPGGPRQVLTCDAQEGGRVPKAPAGLLPYLLTKNTDHSHDHDELDRMEDVGRKACYAQISAKLAAAAPAPAPAAAPAPSTAPAPTAAPAPAAAPAASTAAAPAPAEAKP